MVAGPEMQRGETLMQMDACPNCVSYRGGGILGGVFAQRQLLRCLSWEHP